MVIVEKMDHPEAILYRQIGHETYFYLASSLHKKRMDLLAGSIVRTASQTSSRVTMLDIGAGEGELESRLEGLNNLEKIAVDVSPEAMNVGFENGYFNKTIVVDVEDPDSLKKQLGGEKMDIIVAAEILEHLRHPGVFVRENLIPLLKSGGSFIGSVPNAMQIHDVLDIVTGRGGSYQLTRPLMDSESGHISFFTAFALKKVLEFAGLENVTIVGNGVRLHRNGDKSSELLLKVPILKNFPDRFVFSATKK